MTLVREIALKTWEVSFRPERGDSREFEAVRIAWRHIVSGSPLMVDAVAETLVDLDFASWQYLVEQFYSD